MEVKKAVIPAAGMGTRFLPVTKSMPKEMLPLVDTPAIHFVVKEAVDAGIDDIIIITGRGKRSIENYFDESPELELFLKKKGKTEILDFITEITTMVNVHYIRQKEPCGLPNAILQAEKHVGDEPFAVLLGDDIIKSDTPCIEQLIEVFKKVKSSVLAVQEVPLEKISRYGSIDGEKVQPNNISENTLYKVHDIIEKPRPDDAPSLIASIGRYVFTPEIFDCIHQTKPGVNNELQIVDSIRLLMKNQEMFASEFHGHRYDIGDKLGYLEAVIDYALEKTELSKDLKEFLKTRC